MNYDNIIGTDINIFFIIGESKFKTNDGHKLFHVKCNKCGWETDMRLSEIKKTKNCRHKDIIDNFVYHNKYHWTNKTLQHIFRHMKQRCYDINDKNYKYYGQKNIKICDEWINNPILFEQWSIENGFREGLTIDRIDCKKDYSPENCRWVTHSDNSKYKSTTNLITVNGVTCSGREWSKELNLGVNTINVLLKRYSKEKVIQFIIARLENKTLVKTPEQSWFKLYNIQ